jgi:hypothetical protein
MMTMTGGEGSAQSVFVPMRNNGGGSKANVHPPLKARESVYEPSISRVMDLDQDTLSHLSKHFEVNIHKIFLSFVFSSTLEKKFQRFVLLSFLVTCVLSFIPWC